MHIVTLAFCNDWEIRRGDHGIFHRLYRGYQKSTVYSKGRSSKAGVYTKAVFWLGIMVLMQISRLRFKQSRISLLIPHIYVLGCFVNFLVIFRLEINSFSQRFSKIYENRKF